MDTVYSIGSIVELEYHTFKHTLNIYNLSCATMTISSQFCRMQDIDSMLYLY
jgi:hypothetical protein